MNTEQLKEIVDNGGRVVVKFNNPEIGDYTFLDAGMMARLVSIEWKDDSWKCTFDISEFDSYNTPLQRRDYYDKNNKPSLTAKEAGVWEDTETFYINDDFTEFFDIETNRLLQEYIDSRVDIGYVEWLEKKVESLYRHIG